VLAGGHLPGACLHWHILMPVLLLRLLLPRGPLAQTHLAAAAAGRLLLLLLVAWLLLPWLLVLVPEGMYCHVLLPLLLLH
jgi:hypothetical protein